MALFSKPSQVPRWADTGTVVEPSEAKKDSGWENLEKPPFSFFNYLQNLTGEWVKWIDERFADGSDENELVIKGPANGNEAVRIRSDDTVTFAQPLHAPDYQNAFRVGDDGFNMYLSGSDSYLSFAPDDQIRYDRGNDRFSFLIGGGTYLRMGTRSIDWLVGQQYFGFRSSLGDPYIDFDQYDHLTYDRSADRWKFKIGGNITKLTISPTGLSDIGGLSSFALTFDGTDSYFHWDSKDYIQYDRSSDHWLFKINDSTEMSLDTGGLRLAKGLYVGGTGIPPYDGDIVCEGGLAVGFNGDPGNDEVQINDANFKLGGGTVPKLQFDVDDSFGYVRSSDYFHWKIAGSERMRLLGGGGGDGTYLYLFDEVGGSCQISARRWGLGFDRPIHPAQNKPADAWAEDVYLSRYNLTRTVTGRVSGASGVINGNENGIASVTRVSAGHYNLQFKGFSQDFNGSDHPCFAQPYYAGDQARSATVAPYYEPYFQKQRCRVRTFNSSGSLIDSDFFFISVGI